ADLQKHEKDAASSEAFGTALGGIQDAGQTKDPEVTTLVEQIKDDFVTIHDSGIGFDDLMQSLISDRLVAVMSHLERGQAAEISYKLGEADVTKAVESLLKIAASPDQLNDAKPIEELPVTLQNFAEAAETSGKPELGLDAAALVSDIQSIAASEVGFDENMQKMVAERLRKLVDSAEKVVVEAAPEPSAQAEAEAPPSPADSVAMPPVKDPGKPAAGGHQELSGKTLRVAEEKVDHFMSFVGELIITGEVFAYIQKKLEQYPEVRQVAQEFKNANLSFGELSSNLQKSLMEVRRVPLKSVLQKLHRIIRDTAGQLGKKIDFEIEGEDVQIDKSLLEGLERPLVHMVRNSVDHGVEVPADRIAAGKEETGHVWIKASATEEQFTLSIKDDGKGLDLEAIKNKAVNRGMLSEDQARNMPDKEAFRLIFNAGLSTAKVVTDVSGRGVGMDVVLSNITKMNGNIMVDSIKGQGSTFTILLPMTVTLTVIDGLVARIGDQFYIIPLSDVRESVKPERDQVHKVKGEQEVLNVRGELHPIVRLNRVLGIYSGNVTEDIFQATAVLVEGKRGIGAAFLVDELIGQQSVVVKDLGKEFEHIRSLSGASILGDGRVGLVLSVQGVLIDVGLAQDGD
ncbi:MAG: chemotaxis protein CheA, partial [Planctomycetes bacterium]|nr:chemotaxis protein CheA [Planctomycetota bacterium]